MTSSYTTSVSRSTTYTEARVRHVMAKVLEDLVMVAACELASIERVTKWCEEVTMVLLLQAGELFQIKFARPDGEPAAITYKVSDDGSLSEDGDSGGINYYGLPSGTRASIVLRLRDGAKKRQEAVDYLKGRGWTFDGVVLEDEGERDRGFSSSGYGLTRSKIGKGL
jgi:hypothetical protein